MKNISVNSLAFTCFLLTGYWLLPLWSVSAENLTPSGDFEEELVTRQWVQPRVASQTQEDHMTGDSALRFHLCGWATAPELIDIDPENTYTLRVFVKEPELKLDSEHLPLQVFIGLRFFDDNGEQIPPNSIAAIPNTGTVLAQAASEGDKVLHIEGPPWENVPKGLTSIAFEAKEDFSDLPNLQTAVIAEISAESDGFEIRLASPLERGYPAGTRVRQHRYADFPTIVVDPSTEWTEHVLEIGGVSEPGSAEKGRFWQGVHSVRPSIGVRIRDAASMASKKPIELLIDDVSFSKVD